MVNPWGITSSATSPFWVANNGTSTATLYGGDVSGSPLTRNALTVSISGGLPTGAVFNGSADFVITAGGGTSAARFIFASITGNLSAWRAGNSAVIAASQPGHVYTGLAIGNDGVANFLYAANFASPTLAGSVEVFNSTFTPQSVASFPFVDSGVPALPADFRPFNIQNIGGFIYVTYAKLGSNGRNQNGLGLGYVSKFTTSGVFVQRLVSNGPLNSPWGIAIAPASFGVFGSALLV
ncbi:MAG: TIGR03118 family protein, partial [Acidobacteria bacterium]